MSDTVEMPVATATTLTDHQHKLELLFSNNQLLPRLRAHFEDILGQEFIDYLGEWDIPISFAFDLLSQIALHRRANLQTLVGMLWYHLKDSQATADMLYRAGQAALVDWDPPTRLFVVIPAYTIPSSIQAELDRFQFPLPMVVEPKPIQSNMDTGYLVGRGSVILNDNHHNGDVCLDHLNRMNSVRLTLNFEVAEMIRNKWKNLDKKKESETLEEFNKRVKAFEKYDRVAKDVMGTLMEHSEVFYLTHAYDKRGRTYSRGYHVNTQGNPWNKAVIDLADRELVE